MYLSIEQISASLGRIHKIHPFFGMSFLAFKDARLPVGEATTIVFTQQAEHILNKHYKVNSYNGFYNPFQTSDKENRWTAPRYASTSLQRITADTFGDAFIHPKKSQSWGWRSEYIEALKRHLSGVGVPAFDMAVWLFRNIEWSDDISPEVVRNKFLTEYSILSEEQDALFDLSIPEITKPWMRTTAVSSSELFQLLGRPPGAEPEEGASLQSLEINEVGPASNILYEPAERLNVITGDNSLGKTFLLECIWWALTGSWLEYSAQPRSSAAKDAPYISFGIAARHGSPVHLTTKYNWDRQQWKQPSRREAVTGLVVYARYDGSFAVWDPARARLMEQDGRKQDNASIFLSKKNIWDGISLDDTSGRTQWICNGLLRDWATWQAGGRYEKHYKALVASFERLSPSDSEPLQPGPLTRLPLDARDIPTLRFAYDDVPILYASAGIQRAVALAYMLVWTWFEHLDLSAIIRRQPQRRIVLLVDEVEAHLHPRWQRVIIPAIMNVVSELSDALLSQIHAATHSPMVLASMEPVFDEDRDGLHHLKLEQQSVVLEELPFVKRGRADLWLMSPVFGLEQARSLQAETAMKDAKALQLMKQPSADTVREVNDRLTRYLAQDDDFWPRWRYFAEQHGVTK